jgi:RNA polymerase-binding transcription factor DksA
MKPREVEVEEEEEGYGECEECEREMVRSRLAMCPWCEYTICDDCWTEHREGHGYEVERRREWEREWKKDE